MVAVRTARGLVEGLVDLAHTLDSLDLEVGAVIEPDVVSLRDHLVRTIRSYLVPRLEDPETPLFVVLAGPTGSGKSTLANSLSGMDLSETGPIRPTTKGPVVLASPQSSGSLATVAGVECEVVEGASRALRRMSLVDTPDIDSTSLGHRSMAEALIDSADVVILVTSALRYADEVPWEVLRRAHRRGTPIIHVLNRVTSESSGAYVDLKTRLRESGLDGEVFRIPEHHLPPGQHSMPSLSVRRIASRLGQIGRDRAEHQRRTVDGALDSVISGSQQVASILERAKEWVEGLEEELAGEFNDAVQRLEIDVHGQSIDITGLPASSGRRQRRWLKRHGLTPEEAAVRLDRIGRNLGAAIEDDLGSLTLRPGDMSVELAGIGHPLRSESLRKGVEAVVWGWFDYVSRMTEQIAPPLRNLATVALVESAFGHGSSGATSALLRDNSEPMVARARRELARRLESLYEAAGRRTLAQLAPLIADPYQAKVLSRKADRVARFLDQDA